MDNIDNIKKRILELEAEWQIYHKNSKDNRMPDMQELAKLRCKLREFERINK